MFNFAPLFTANDGVTAQVRLISYSVYWFRWDKCDCECRGCSIMAILWQYYVDKCMCWSLLSQNYCWSWSRIPRPLQSQRGQTLHCLGSSHENKQLGKHAPVFSVISTLLHWTRPHSYRIMQSMSYNNQMELWWTFAYRRRDTDSTGHYWQYWLYLTCVFLHHVGLEHSLKVLMRQQTMFSRNISISCWVEAKCREYSVYLVHLSRSDAELLSTGVTTLGPSLLSIYSTLH